MKNITVKQIVYIGILLFLGYSLFGNLRLFLKAKSSLAEAQQALETQTQVNQQLHEKLDEVGKQIYIERVARDTLGLAYENEVVFILPEASEVKKLSPRYLEAENKKSTVKEIPHWREWVEIFN